MSHSNQTTIVPKIVLVLIAASAAFFAWTCFRSKPVRRPPAAAAQSVAVPGRAEAPASGAHPAAVEETPRGGTAARVARPDAASETPKAVEPVRGPVSRAAARSVAAAAPQDDPYAWLEPPPPGTPQPPLNVAIDFTRADGGGRDKTEGCIREIPFAGISPRLLFKPVYLELTDDELGNANVFILPKGNVYSEMNRYSPAEKKVLDTFVRRGGLAVFWDDDIFVGRDLFGNYGATMRRVQVPKAADLTLRAPLGPDVAVAVTDCDQAYVLEDASGTNWFPVVEGPSHEMYMAFHRVGKGLFVYVSRALLWGSRWDWWNRKQNWNPALLPRFFSACARLVRPVDGRKPFKMRELESAPVRLVTRDGIHLYASASRRKDAETLKTYLDRMLPALRELTGYESPERWGRRPEQLDYVIAERCRGNDPLAELGDRLVNMHAIWKGQSAWWHNFDLSVCGYLKRHAWFDTENYAQSFDFCFTYYVHVVVMEKLGYVDQARKAFEDALSWRKEKNVLKGFWSDGRPKDGVDESPIENDGELGGLLRAKVFALMEELRKENPNIIREAFQTLEKLAKQGRVKGSATLHQTAAVFSRAMGRDVFPLFEDYGFRVDRRRARFSRTKAELKEVEPVDGKPALKSKSFVLKKGGKRAQDVVLDLVGCPAGTAQMGSRGDANGPLWSHAIAITEPFWIGKTQITKQQWAVVMGDRKRSPQEYQVAQALGGGQSAADHLAYSNVLAFCEKLTEKFRYVIPLGYVFRPPTEAEWEYAANAGRSDGPCRTAGGLTTEEIRKLCWTKVDSVELLERRRVRLPKGFDRGQLPMGPVAKRQPNAWGIYDTVGNGWEWCLDTFAPPPEGKNAADARTREHLRTIFKYEPKMADSLFSYDGPDAYACARGMDYAAPDACTKTVFPVTGEPAPEMTFRVCLGPDLTPGVVAHGPQSR